MLRRYLASWHHTHLNVSADDMQCHLVDLLLLASRVQRYAADVSKVTTAQRQQH